MLIKSGKKVKVIINENEYILPIVPQESVNQPLTEETVSAQIKKTGNTPFEICDLSIELDDRLFLSIKDINEIRREAFSKYEEQIISSYKRKIERKKPEKILPIEKSKKTISLFITKLRPEHLNVKTDNIKRIYFSLKDVIKNNNIIREFKCEKYVVMPTITKKNYDRMIQKNMEKIANIVDGFVISNIGQLKHIDNIKTNVIADESMNVFNSYTIAQLKDYGFNEITHSPELTKQQINSIKSILPCELKAYGRQKIMASEYCVVGSVAGGFSKSESCLMPCTRENKYYLRDRKDVDFLVIPDNVDCQCSIFNSKITSIVSRDMMVDSIRIDVQDETINEINNIVAIAGIGEKLSGNQYTNGHINRPV